MERPSAAELRAARGEWSLAHDRRLLALLQDIHERVAGGCAAAAAGLAGLRAAGAAGAVALHNVNNRLHALSSSQFIESRVDDDDVTGDAVPGPAAAPAPTAAPAAAPGAAARGLAALRARHEPLALEDSASDSDDDAPPRVVLRPIRAYRDRPLPLVCGTPAWRRCWHAGLLGRDDSDESGGSDDQRDDYSPSEDESVSSAGAPGPESDGAAPPAPPSAAGVTAPPAPLPPLGAPAPPWGYVTQLPYPAPLLRASPPPPPRPPSGGGDASERDDESDDAACEQDNYPPQQPRDKRESTLFTDSQESDLFKNVAALPTGDRGATAKKPVGGISVFGGGAGERIGAAILDRARRGSTTSDDEPETINTTAVKDTPSPVQPKSAQDEKSVDNKDVIKDLFGKNVRVVKKKDRDVAKVEAKVSVECKKVDLFSDDIFDDIDDIFSSKVILKPSKPKSNTKSLFDDDDDALFSDIGVTKVDAVKTASEPSKSIFDNDDDLFTDTTKNKLTSKPYETSNEKETNQKVDDQRQKNNTKSLFDDSDDALFSDVRITKVDTVKTTSKPYKSIFDSDDDLFSDTNKDKLTSKPFETSRKIEKTDADVSENNSNKIDERSSISYSDDELFGEKSQVKSAPVVKNIPATSKPKSLFDDDNNSDVIFPKVKSASVTQINPKYYTPEKDDTHTDVNQVSTPYTKIERSILTTSNLNPLDKCANKESLNSTQADENVVGLLAQSTEITNKSSGDSDLFDDNDEPKSPETSQCSDSKNDINENSQILAVGHLDGVTSDNGDSIFNSTNNVNTYSEEIIPNYPINTSEQKSVVNDTEKEYTKNVATNIVTKIKGVDSANENDNCFENNAPKYAVQDQLFDCENNKVLSGDYQVKAMITEEYSKAKSHKEAIPPAPDSVSENDFDDLFLAKAPPPIFDKSKEAKKSQNVNALFDDDSDDEALFFKRNDGISDEKPPPLAGDKDIFSIFQDEPPAIDKDIDFVLNKDVTDCKVKSKVERDIVQVGEVTSSKIPDNADGVTQSKVEKVVGKLKPSTLNINVGSLLPGAMPKKLIKERAQVVTQDIKPEEPKETESKLVKSVSFDSDPDTAVLDNKLSKARPKIQIKRRPSTRRARIEAVRRSAIDFDEVDVGQDPESNNANKIPVDTSIDSKNKIERDADFVNECKKVTLPERLSDSVSDVTDAVNPVNSQEPLFNDAPINQSHSINEQVTKNDTSADREIKTDVLNINDQDTYVFKHPSASPSTHEEQNYKDDKKNKADGENGKYSKNKKQIKNPLFDSDDDDDLFNVGVSKLAEKPKTQSAVKTPTEDVKPVKDARVAKTSMFNDSSDEESLFGAKSKLTKTTSKSVVFNSDSDDELFAPKKTRILDKTVPEKSLFGDDDDDDLFGGKSRKS